MNKSTATKIDKYVTTNGFHEKVEMRTYSSGHKRAYIYQGNRWWVFNIADLKRDIESGFIFYEPKDLAAWSKIIYEKEYKKYR